MSVLRQCTSLNAVIKGIINPQIGSVRTQRSTGTATMLLNDENETLLQIPPEIQREKRDRAEGHGDTIDSHKLRATDACSTLYNAEFKIKRINVHN